MDPRPPSPTEILEELVNTLRASLLPAPAPLPSASASPTALPAVYAGDPADCGGFLLQLSYIEMQPQKFLTEHSKVTFLIFLLSDQALIWAKAIWNANTAIINSYEAFTNRYRSALRGRPVTALVTGHFLYPRVNSEIPHSGGHLRPERVSPAQCLSSGTRRSLPCPDGNLR